MHPIAGRRKATARQKASTMRAPAAAPECHMPAGQWRGRCPGTPPPPSAAQSGAAWLAWLQGIGSTGDRIESVADRMTWSGQGQYNRVQHGEASTSRKLLVQNQRAGLCFVVQVTASTSTVDTHKTELSSTEKQQVRPHACEQGHQSCRSTPVKAL